MKRIMTKILIQTIVILSVYGLLLRILSGTNIIAGVFCPGPHLPVYHPILIGFFIFCRFYVVLLPGFILSRLGWAWMKQKRFRPAK